ncbi:MAG TPA: AarF/ABC1/UbiB kinase family protein [Thermoplasmataceae archaeon]|nr:AarF/ABC1/UbiB kinase family protein [Thermoplasmatales archaeon AK]HLH86412.1 AarF/ABC1/UbiB kinase family protein [Thermoplasmataceae archaeon]
MVSGDPNYRGIRISEIRVFLKLYPVFRRYLRDREKTRKETEPTWDYYRERNGKIAVQAFMDLGPTFIKLGQVLSARPDLLPREYISSFEKLQDEVPPAPFQEVEPILRRNLGDIDSVFDSFDRNAISGASLGQVYRAVYRGRDVAVKVNRPNIENILKRDLIVIDRLLRLAKGRIENFLYISVSNVINDFKGRIFDEIDYRKEASNADRIRKNISGRDRAIVPEIIREISSKEVLSLQYIDGTKITDVEALKQKGLDLKELAWNLDLLFMRMLLRDDIFHADPHPGNISVADDGTLILYDFGMIGSLDRETRFKLLSLYDGLVHADPDAIIDALVALRALSPVANRAIIRRSMEMLIASMEGKNPEESEIRELLDIANGVIFEFPFRLPRALVLYMRMSSILEGVCLRLDPDFKFVKILRQLLYQEGLLDELYRQQLSNFVQKSIVAIEKGLDALPLLKRRLEEENNNEKRQDRSVSAAIFLSAVLISAVLEAPKLGIYFFVLTALDLVAFAALLLRRKK